MTEAITPAKHSAGFRRVFAWYTRRLVSKRFNAIRFTADSIAALESAHRHDGPIILAMNHASWWDPLLGLLISERFFQHRPSAAPMAMEQWNTFKFMRKLGIFGVHTDHPDAINQMTAHVETLFDEQHDTLLAITPQGEFADVRVPVRIRPGISSIAAVRPDAVIISVAFEYAFWTDQRPEVFVRASAVDRPEASSTAAWHRAITRSMRANAEALSEAVIARDPTRFVEPFERRGASVNRTYDTITKLRGQSAHIPTEPTSGRPTTDGGAP